MNHTPQFCGRTRREALWQAGAGFAGCTITFVDYLNEFQFFQERVLPRLERAGLRHPAGTR